MSAIAGAVSWTRSADYRTFCADALDDMRALGSGRRAVRSLGPCAFGHSLAPFLTEDRHDRQPLEAGSPALLLSADARIDNRAELIAALGSGGNESDAALILACWERWGEAAPRRLLGDFAFALWDERRRELFLTRSPAGSRAVFYHAGAQFAAFATLPQPLHRLVPRTLNVAEMARRLGGGAYFGNSESLFGNIFAVDPGTVLRVKQSSISVDRYWHPRSVVTVKRNREDAAREMNWELRRATEACMRRADGPVSSHLSGGRDSGAVTACAASILSGSGGKLLAFTAAPREGFAKADGRYCFDESASASLLARQFPNIRHRVSRSPRRWPLCEALDRANRLHAAPMGNPANLAYWMRLQSEAADAGSRVLLTGANGNFSITIGGLAALPDVLREEGFEEWWTAARRLSHSANLPWKTLLNQSFGHRIPAPLHRLLRDGIHRPTGQTDYPAFTVPLRDAIDRVGAQPNNRPLASYRRRVAEIYEVIDYSDNLGVGLHGIDLRDPTADRRLIEFCLSLPAADIVGSQGERPIYDLAFEELVPAQVRGNRLKGFQGADWFEVYDPEDVRAGLRRYGANPAVREFVDIAGVDRLLDAWPAEAGHDLRSYGLYANHVLVAVALASWLDVHF